MKTSARSFVALAHTAALTLALMTLATSVWAQTLSYGSVWSSAGSVGIVDESHTSLVSLNGATAALRPTAAAGSAVYLRYPVSLVPGALYATVFEVPSTTWTGLSFFTRLKFTVTFQKNDDGAYVVASLKRLRLSDGVVSTLAAADSGSSFAMPGVQSVDRTITCAAGCADPLQYAYFVEAAVWKAWATSDPRLAALRVHLF